MRNLEMAKEIKGTAPESHSGSRRYSIIAASLAVIVICLIGLSFYLLLKSEKSIRKSLYSLDSRLLKIEDRLTRIESVNKSNSIIDEQRTRLEISLMNRIDSLEALIDMKNSKKVDDTLHSEAIKEPVKIKEVTKEPVSDIEKYHVVAPGETLYRISVNYNIPVNELRRLNNIGPQSVIQVGQKLQISK
ncbi:LysM peptidoglycan-binding domain-containing protein [Thermodesulfobacteriota bacterium]